MKKLLLLLLLIPSLVEAQTVRGDRFTFNLGPCTMRSGVGAPSPGLGFLCDTYIDTATGILWLKQGGGWVVSGVSGTGTTDTVAKWTSATSIGNSTIVDVSGGNMTIAPAGDLVINPTGNDVLPTNNYDINLGMLTNKYLSLHAAELWVETLVAQSTMATIGGRILVAPTNILAVDLAPASTTITVKYNNFANGDRVYMEADAKVEFFAITSGASGSAGAYNYSVTRNLDGTGANQWYAGDAMLDTGTTGNGFIDLYSVRGVKAGTEIGPTVVGNVRTGTTYNEWEPRWAIGNMNGLYGYSGSTYGAAFGVPTGARVTVDGTNGIRIYGGDNDQKVTIDTSGNATFDGNLTIGSGTNQLRNSQCQVGVDEWVSTPGMNDHGLPVSGPAQAFPDWGLLDGTQGCYVAISGSPGAGTVTDIVNNQFFGVTAGGRYEYSAYVGMHRANAFVYLVYYNSSNTIIGYDYGTSNTCTPANGNGGKDISGWCRTGVIATAITGAVYAQLVIRTVHTGEATPYTFYTRAFFGAATIAQEDLSPWTPAGLTEITGGLIKTDAVDARIIAAGTITATEIAASTITADKLSVSTLSAITANLGTVTAGSILGATAEFGSGSNRVTLNSSGITLSEGSSAQDQIKWDDGSYIESSSDTLNLHADGDVVLAAGLDQVRWSGSGSGNLNASNGELGNGSTPWEALYLSPPTTSDALHPIVINGYSIQEKTDGHNGGSCNIVDVEYGIVTGCTTAPEPAVLELQGDFEIMKRQVDDILVTTTPLVAQTKALTTDMQALWAEIEALRAEVARLHQLLERRQ